MSNNKYPNIVRGGIALPIKNKTNYYYMVGRKHENGGIDIGKNPRTGLEVEDGEVMHISNDSVRVFSAQPFLNGESPAQKVIKGENPNTVFKAQENYKDRNNINDDGTKKKKMGGLSRSKDYGSKTKPYPKVKDKDFAGNNRSYPIPTKSDAIDALRLAGLHGRNDVKAKVYNKYPELKNKSEFGGVYSITNNGETKLRMNPSTGEKAIDRLKCGGNRKKAKLGKEDWGDLVGVASNIGSGITGYLLNRKTLNDLEYSPAPISQRATKLKTRININPQLDKMRENIRSYEQNIDANTSSSSVALSRKQKARLANIMNTNKLYANKENIETELINKDKLNRQAVSNANIEAYNKWVDNKSNFDNNLSLQKAENNISLLDNINKGIQNAISNYQKRSFENKNLAAQTFAYPNLPAEFFYNSGIWDKKTYDEYRKLYPNK